jgi:small neutral amino acid transporter SnatA (MarC family)
LGGIIAAVLTFFDFQKGLGHLTLYSFLVPFSTFYVTTIVVFLFGNPIIRKIITPHLKWFERISGAIICSLAIVMIFG